MDFKNINDSYQSNNKEKKLYNLMIDKDVSRFIDPWLNFPDND